MIKKTVHWKRRYSKTWNYGGDKEQIDKYQIETWWLFWLIPIYSKETLISTDM